MTDVKFVEPFYDCPRYQKCSVNNCPLCTRYPDMYTDPEGPEKVCHVAKSIRIRIAAKYPGMLRYEGMTPREYTARKKWESLSIEEQEKFKERGRKSLHLTSNYDEDIQTLQVMK